MKPCLKTKAKKFKNEKKLNVESFWREKKFGNPCSTMVSEKFAGSNTQTEKTF